MPLSSSPTQAKTAAVSVMVARAAQWNMSVFRSAGLLPAHDVAREYLSLALQFDNHVENSKYCVQTMHGHPHSTTSVIVRYSFLFGSHERVCVREREREGLIVMLCVEY